MIKQIYQSNFVIKPIFNSKSRLYSEKPLFMNYNSNVGSAPMSVIYKNKGLDI